MRLLDSNIIIYATAPENEWLRTWFEVEPFAVSQISQIEVLVHPAIFGVTLFSPNSLHKSNK